MYCVADVSIDMSNTNLMLPNRLDSISPENGVNSGRPTMVAFGLAFGWTRSFRLRLRDFCSGEFDAVVVIANGEAWVGDCIEIIGFDDDDNVLDEDGASPSLSGSCCLETRIGRSPLIFLTSSNEFVIDTSLSNRMRSTRGNRQVQLRRHK